MRSVLGIEIIKIRGVLEVVGVYGPVFHNVVRHNVVVVFLDFERDAFFSQDLFGDGQDLGVRRRRSGNGDLGSVKCGIIHRGIEAVTGLFDGADNGAGIFFGDEIGDLLAGESSNEGLDLRLVLIALLDGQDVGVGRIGAFDHKGLLDRVHAGVQRVVGIDDGIVHVL